MIIGGVALAAVAAAAVIASTGGSANTKSPSTSASVRVSTVTTHTSHRPTTTKPAAKAEPPAASPAETGVVVLNGTETPNLAHRASAELQQGGYTQSTALNGRPPGANQVTVVEYAGGHRGDAEGVAHSLSVTRVQPLEPGVAALAGSATVVVIVGADRAASVP